MVLELPDDNPKTALGTLKTSMSYIPTFALGVLARVMKYGAVDKGYGRFNWRDQRVTDTVYYDAAMRHLMALADGEWDDPESGEPHLGHVMACCAIMLDADAVGHLNHKLLDFESRKNLA